MIENTSDKEQFIDIYFYSKLGMGRNAIEDDLDEILADKGEVIGGGSGPSGSNIDIEIYEGSAADFLGLIRTALKKLEVPDDTIIVINQERFQVYE
ncbi:hypothetical protein IC235_07520 [Hymenobacter sp. BT664]|uniref:Uncharacterized protein n=1 Tax=Hymenobacter montanus TaxID=2771359 RepID=A0A927GIV0_9BACT|nr:hypothetical protein [Hymenobacter montanus]MBD2767740.1 hypothetical protein [Hymenobacter montanus]